MYCTKIQLKSPLGPLIILFIRVSILIAIFLHSGARFNCVKIKFTKEMPKMSKLPKMPKIKVFYRFY